MSKESYEKGFADGHKCCELLKLKAEEYARELEAELQNIARFNKNLEQKITTLGAEAFGREARIMGYIAKLARYEQGIEVERWYCEECGELSSNACCAGYGGHELKLVRVIVLKEDV